MKILIKDCSIVPMNGTLYQDKYYFTGSIGIVDNKIALVSSCADKISSFETPDCYVINGKGHAVMPGLINTHTHAAMTLLRGYADDMALMDWLQNKIWPFESKMKHTDFYVGTKLGIAEMISSGTTTYVDMYFDPEANAQAISESGIRGYFGVTMMDFSKDSVCNSIDENVNKYHNTSDGRVQLMIAPHAPYTCSPDTLRQAVSIAKKYNLILHTHLCETKAEMLGTQTSYGVNPVEYYRQNGVFDVRTIAAHGVYLSADDAKLLSKYDVTIAHNPNSNMKLSSGIAPVEMLQEYGINVSIGTDGASSNNNLDMIEELRSASLLQKVSTANPCCLNAYDSIKMATVNGAKAIGRENELGQIKEGMLADIIMIDLMKPHLYPHHNIISNIAYCASGSDVDCVIVNGKILMENRKLKTIDTASLYNEVEQSLERIKNNNL